MEFNSGFKGLNNL